MDTERLKELLAPVLPYLRSPWVMGILLLFLVVYGVLALSYASQLSQQDELRAKRDQLASIAARSAALERLEEKEAEFQAIQESIPSADLTEIDVFRSLWDLAAEAGLNPGNVEPELQGEPTNQKVGNTQYRVLSFSMVVKGDYESVWNLIQMLDSGETDYKTLVLDATTFNPQGESTSATVDFKIYTRTAGQ